MLHQPWDPGMPSQQQPQYQPVKYCTYYPVLGSFKNWNILQLSHKAISSGEIDKIIPVVLDNISDNMASLVQNGKYCAINITYKTKMV